MKLLRVLQQGELERVGGRETIHVDVRVVAGTQRDLAEEIRAGTFRDDLYYRLNVVSLALPPLRARKSDIPALVAHFLATSPAADAKGIKGVTPGALSALFGYDWPGNVRELASVVERAVAVAEGPELAADDLSPVLQGGRADELGRSRSSRARRCSRSSARRSCGRSSRSAARPRARRDPRRVRPQDPVPPEGVPERRPPIEARRSTASTC